MAFESDQEWFAVELDWGTRKTAVSEQACRTDKSALADSSTPITTGA